YLVQLRAQFLSQFSYELLMFSHERRLYVYLFRDRGFFHHHRLVVYSRQLYEIVVERSSYPF
ncbi:MULTISPECIES: hypothetical protein, partial [Bacillus cereus group]|uniref:hypothetical protein n=2 Tax=Bacillus cereus group TaxID=86661 RepID=UPI00197A9C34